MEQPIFDDPLVIKEEIKEENDFEKQELVLNAISDWSTFFDISKTALNSLLRILNKEFSFIPHDFEALQNNINAEKFEHATDFLDIHVDDDNNDNDSESDILIKENNSVRQTRTRKRKTLVKSESLEKLSSFDNRNDEESDQSDTSVDAEKQNKSTKSNRNKSKNSGHGSQCPICGVFRQNMIIHMRIHTGERPYKCSECEMRFKDRSTRKTHEKVHSEEKAFKCDFCEKQFRSKANRMEHMRTHTGKSFFVSYYNHLGSPIVNIF